MSRCPSDLRLERYLAGLGPAPVAAHVGACAACQSTLAGMRRLGEVFLREIHPATRERVIEGGRPWRWMGRWLLCVVPAALAAAALAFFGATVADSCQSGPGDAAVYLERATTED
jgi:hypothetical protein